MNTFRHSGKLGDIIYSLPAVRALGGGVFYVDAATQYLEKPALGNEAAEMMVELLETQNYIHSAALYQGQLISHDLDLFRRKAIPIHALNAMNSESDKFTGLFFGNAIRNLRRQFFPIVEVDLPQFHWAAVGLSGNVDRQHPWLTGIPPKPIAQIVISRTGRYSGNLDWQTVGKYADHAIFLGLEREWRAFCAAYFQVEFYPVTSFLEFTKVVAGAKLYVGNQSFGMALAEAMLVPRVAELGEANSITMSRIHGHKVFTKEIVEAYIQS